MMLFPCALLCFLLASIASAAGPAHLRRPHDVLLAHGTKPGPRPPAYNPEKLKTVKQLELKEGHVYSVRRRAAGLYYNPYDNVLAVYIGPVPKFSKIAFVLVLERLTLGLPLKYKKESTKKLFGENGPFTKLLDQQTEVGINFEWAQVAVAQKIKPYTGGEDIKLADEMLEIIQSNMKVNYDERCKGKPNWEWNWDLLSLGQPLIESLVTKQWRLNGNQIPGGHPGIYWPPCGNPGTNYAYWHPGGNPGTNYWHPDGSPLTNYFHPGGNPGTNYWHSDGNPPTNYWHPGGNPGTNYVYWHPGGNSPANYGPTVCNPSTNYRKQVIPRTKDRPVPPHPVGANPNPSAKRPQLPFDPQTLKTVEDLDLKEGLVYFVFREATGIAYAKGTVAVVYLGPVPDNEMIAFVLVLETQVHLPKIYEAQKVNDLFGEKVPSALKMKNIVTVGVNFKRAQVAVAELLSRDNRDKETGDGDLTGWEMLETVKSNIKENYETRKWEWNWDQLDLGQERITRKKFPKYK